VGWIQLAWNKEQEKNLLTGQFSYFFEAGNFFYQPENSLLREIAT
jgi:hypothetical protein